MARSSRAPRWLRPAVDVAMAVALLLQMMPGKLGNSAHEVAGVAFVALLTVHHVLNRGWWGRLSERQDVRLWCVRTGDVVLAACVVGTALTGLLMSRSLVPALAVPAVAHVVRPLHGSLAYMALMTCAFHVGLHVRIVRGYMGRRGGVRVPWAQLLVALAIGAWAFVRLGVFGRLLGLPSFPDGMTPLPVLLVLHLALCLPFVVTGSMVDAMTQGGKRHG